MISVRFLNCFQCTPEDFFGFLHRNKKLEKEDLPEEERMELLMKSYKAREARNSANYHRKIAEKKKKKKMKSFQISVE